MPPLQTPDVAALPIPKKERYTYADYAELPESAPYELIAGSLVMVPSPTFQHQQVSLRLSAALFHYVEAHESGTVVTAPMDVMLEEDTTVQPDLVYIAHARREIIGEQRIEGAPDLIAEILSPSTAHRDVGIKSLFGFWFAGESEQQCGENGTAMEVRSRGYGPRSGPICSPLKPLAAQSKKSKQVLRSGCTSSTAYANTGRSTRSRRRLKCT
jgi:hypothetical protein